MSQVGEPSEVVEFQRRRELPGVEVRTLRNTSRTWRSYSADFELLLPRSWCGEIDYRGGRYTLEPGAVFCAQPAEVVAARRVHRPGTLRAVVIDPKVLEHHAIERELAPARLVFTPCSRLSTELAARLLRFIDVLVPGSSRLELEEAFFELVDVVLRELVDRASPPRAAIERRVPALPGAARLSRFQVLRAFKQRFGLPPYRYQLGVRLALAKQALRDGLSPAQVAADFGFVDQSHLTRHFKRFAGITPAQYARVGSEAHR